MRLTCLACRLRRCAGGKLRESLLLSIRRAGIAAMDGGFFEFRRQLDDKARLYGASVVVADRWFPSSKTCSCCGSVKAEPDLSQRVFRLRALRIRGGSGLQRLRKILNDWPQALRRRGTLWRGSQEPRETRLKEAGTERRGSALRSLAYLRVGFGEQLRPRAELALRSLPRGGVLGWGCTLRSLVLMPLLSPNRCALRTS
jgi:hypothetical protein